MTVAMKPPMDMRITKSLLGYGVIAGPIYVVAVAAQAFWRDGFDPTRHAASQLANGDFGWVQIVTFLVTGAMTIAAAVGVRRAVGSRWAAGLIGMYGAALMAAGIFRADPSDGFPPGTAEGTAMVSWHGMAHLACGTVGFGCLIAACFVFARRFARAGEQGWAWYSRITAIVFGASFVALASGWGGRIAVVAFTVAVVLAWAWLSAVSVKLYRSMGPGC
ncbi:MAG: DUF998 domain-containing protein [Mycobacteriaceae bacterium]|nr:DUF998 domain-containing protein [Mycobacteriaceae bacterium]